MSVTLYGRGAIVTREVELPAQLAEGRVEVVLNGITALLHAGSVKAVIDSETRVIAGVRTYWMHPDEQTDGHERLSLAQEVELLALELECLSEKKSALGAQRDSIAQLQPRPRKRKGRKSFQCAPLQRVREGLAVAGAVDDVLTELDRELQQIEHELQQVKEAHQAKRIALAHQSSTSNDNRRATTRVVVVLRGSGSAALRISYVVKAARWWPVYGLRVQQGPGKERLVGTWSMEALVAQRSGEDWSDVAFSFCTANMVDDVRLPKLPTLRFGRAQPEKPSGYRPAPPDLDRMFDGFDKAFEAFGALEPVTDTHSSEITSSTPAMPAIPQPIARQIGGALGMPLPAKSMRLKADASSAKQAELHAKAHADQARTLNRLMQSRMQVAKTSRALMGIPMAVESAPMSEPCFDEPEASTPASSASPGLAPEAARDIEPTDAWLDYDRLQLVSGFAVADQKHRRGTLRIDPYSDRQRLLDSAQAAIESLVVPMSVSDPVVSRGSFDHAYQAQGRSDVPADGQTHRVPVIAGEATVQTAYRTVPQQDAQVYREWLVKNPFAVPLLDGPVEVYIDGSLLAATTLDRVDKGGVVRLGVGVEDRLRVARNVTVREQTTGLLGGTTSVVHDVQIDVRSLLGSRATVQVLERVPVSDEPDLEVKLGKSSHPLEPYTQQERAAPIRGGLRMTLDIDPGVKQTINYSFTIILPSKNEVVGGNRRD